MNLALGNRIGMGVFGSGGSAVFNPYYPGSGRYITFTNPSSTHKVWRDGTQYTGTIGLPPNFTTASWDIIDHKTRVIVKSGTGLSVSNTFAYNTGSNVYDILVTAGNGSYAFRRMFVGEITCLPPTFSEAQADEIWNFSAGELVHAPGFTPVSTRKKVYVKGAYSGSNNFQILWAKYSNADQPMHILASPGTQVKVSSSAAFAARIGPDLQNILLDGCGDENVQYGFRFDSIGGTGQIIYFQGADEFTVLANASKNVTVCGVQCECNDSASSFTIQNVNTVTVNYDTYTFDRPIMFNCAVNYSVDEAYYIGHFGDALSPTYAYSGISNALYYRLKSNHSGRESFQIGSNFGSEIFSCEFINGGNLDNSLHRNEIQFGEGNRDISFYMNFTSGSRNIFSGFTGRRGKNAEVFSNVFSSTGRSGSDGTNFFTRLDQNETYSSLYWGIYNNTIKMSTYVPFELWRADTSVSTSYSSLFISNNLLSSDTTTQYVINNTLPSGSISASNIIYTDINNFMFFDAANKNYRLGSTLSPAFTSSRVNPYKSHSLANYDFEGVEYLSFSSSKGAYSGYELFTGPPIIKNITSVPTQTDITVPNGTSFNSIGFPSKILVSLDDSSNRSISASWASGSYNAATASTYPITGSFSSLPYDITNGSNLKVYVNVIVQVGLPAVNAKVNFFGATSQSGWFGTGGASPFGNVDLGQIGSTGIGIRYVSGGGYTWNDKFASGANTGGNTGVFPDNVLKDGIYTNSPNKGKIELYNYGGSSSLESRNFRLEMLGSRVGLTSPMTSRYAVNGGVSQDLNCIANTSGSVIFTGIQAISGVITITVENVAPSTDVFCFINGLTIDSE